MAEVAGSLIIVHGILAATLLEVFAEPPAPSAALGFICRSASWRDCEPMVSTNRVSSHAARSVGSCCGDRYDDDIGIVCDVHSRTSRVARRAGRVAQRKVINLAGNRKLHVSVHQARFDLGTTSD